jgi:hypothetical protein
MDGVAMDNLVLLFGYQYYSHFCLYIIHDGVLSLTQQQYNE